MLPRSAALCAKVRANTACAISDDYEFYANVVITGFDRATITVTTPNGVATSSSQVFVQPPGIQSISPTSGPVGTLVTLSGYDFLAVYSVNYGSYTGTSSKFTIVNSSTITTTVPAGATTGQIWIWSPGAIGPSAQTFTVLPTTTLRVFNSI